MVSEETKQKMRDAWKKRKQVPFSQETRKKMSDSRKGEKNPYWKGGKIKHVVKNIKERDDFTCKSCGLRDSEIAVVDHIRPQYIRPDLYTHSTNLQTLCPNCHARKTIKDRKDIAEFNRLKMYVKKHRYQNSVCRRGWLHDFRQIKETSHGFLERCLRCGKKAHFPGNVPNHVYLSYHVRSALQKGEPLFNREYPNAY
jgi:5-methylcytosine-specific restriction endonuclease McrA